MTAVAGREDLLGAVGAEAVRTGAQRGLAAGQGRHAPRVPPGCPGHDRGDAQGAPPLRYRRVTVNAWGDAAFGAVADNGARSGQSWRDGPRSVPPGTARSVVDWRVIPVRLSGAVVCGVTITAGSFRLVQHSVGAVEDVVRFFVAGADDDTDARVRGDLVAVDWV